jgi:hypothetical protein
MGSQTREKLFIFYHIKHILRSRGSIVTCDFEFVLKLYLTLKNWYFLLFLNNFDVFLKKKYLIYF